MAPPSAESKEDDVYERIDSFVSYLKQGWVSFGQKRRIEQFAGFYAILEVSMARKTLCALESY